MIKANFNAYSTYVTDSLYQWDLNQVLRVTGLNLSVVPEVHFSNANMDKAIVRQASMENHVVSVGIPNSLLQDPLTIHAHIGIYEGSTFKVVEKVEIPVIAKERPVDYRIEDADEEIYSFKALENAVANMTTKAEANVISARIDTIIANANSAEGNSELVDIRVGEDGTVYTSAGEAVRTQVQALSKSAIALADNSHYLKNLVEIYSGEKAVVNGSGNVGEKVSLKRYEANNVCGCIIGCKPGDKFIINADGYPSDSRLWCFTDKDDICLLRASNGVDSYLRYNNPTTIIAPEGAVKLSCNWLKSSPIDAYICNITEEMERLDKIENASNKVAKFDASRYKYAFPKRGFFKEFEAKNGYANDMRYSAFYNLFHELYMTYAEKTGLEEIDLSIDYLEENPSDHIPTYISNIENGKLLMYKLPMIPRNNSGTTAKFKPVDLLLISGIHGGERKSIYDNYLLLNDLLQETITDPCIQAIRSFCNVYIIPMVNPYGIENNTRNNMNVNLNRDFATTDWVATSDSFDSPNSQFETRVISYWIDKICPTCIVDHHTSSGSDETEWKFTHWGDSRIETINSVIEENALDVTPFIRKAFYEKLKDYNFCYGNTADYDDTTKKYGLLTNYAHSKGYICCTFEVVMHLKWDGNYIFGYDESEENDLVSINYFEYINFLMKFIRMSVDLLDTEVQI